MGLLISTVTEKEYGRYSHYNFANNITLPVWMQTRLLTELAARKQALESTEKEINDLIRRRNELRKMIRSLQTITRSELWQGLLREGKT